MRRLLMVVVSAATLAVAGTASAQDVKIEKGIKVYADLRDAVAWLAVPAVYGAYTLAHGAVSGFYPYPFLDAGVLGVEAVLATMAVFAAGFLALGLGIVAVDHIGASRRTN